MTLELANVNSSFAFWQALGSNVSRFECACHSHLEDQFQLSGHSLFAQKLIRKAIEVVLSEDFNEQDPIHRDHLFTLSALHKAQDQISGGRNFVSSRSREFNEFFGVKETLHGKKFGEEIRLMSDAKNYLIEKFQLRSTKDKAKTILESHQSTYNKARQMLNLGWQDSVEPLVEIAGSARKAMPSLIVVGMILGTLQLFLRAAEDQKTANAVRDNIGASTEAMAFFVLVNGVLENLSHSFILAAPAFAGTLAFDKAKSGLEEIYKYCAQLTQGETQNIQVQEGDVDLEVGEEQIEISGSFYDHKKALKILQELRPLFHENEMWRGLRKRQLAYQDNKAEERLKSEIDSLIGEIVKNPREINALFRRDYNQSLNDIFLMLRAYEQVYNKENSGSDLGKLTNEFCDFFARDGVLLSQPSKDVKNAALLLKIDAGLVSFEERIAESLPHMPTGEQVFLAAVVIGSLLLASAIYEKVTGQKEVYSDYVTNFPDHLFRWLQLEEMYKNMGGGAELTEGFKNFFAGFNLAENSTHLGIAAAPFFIYAQQGSKMFENLHHEPINYLHYAFDLVGEQANKISGLISHKNLTVPFSPDLSQKNENQIEFGEIVKTENNVGVQTDFVDTKVEAKADPDQIYCGSAADLLKQFSVPNSVQPKSGQRVFSRHVHTSNCNHK